MYIDISDKFYGAWWGAFLGDALAMPTHGYSSQKMLQADYGTITDFAAAKPQHPESVLNAITPPELPAQFDCIGSARRELWKQYAIHPHHNFEAGRNTLSLFLSLHMAVAVTNGGADFHFEDWMKRYQAVMTAPNGHPDTFIPAVHRKYFENLAAGKDVKKFGCPDAHIGDIMVFLPLILEGISDLHAAKRRLPKALAYFCTGETAPNTAYFVSEIVSMLVRGATLEDVLYTIMTPDRHFSLAYPYRRWIKNREEESAINMMGRFARLEEAVPLSIYLSLKYAGDLKGALLANANIGGETCGRGALIGMFMGAQCGLKNMPQEMLAKLKYAGEIQALSKAVHDHVMKFKSAA